jgi:hypothetical protein
MSVTEQYQRRAQNCLQQAEEAMSQQAREQWLKLSTEWLRLVDAAKNTPHVF